MSLYNIDENSRIDEYGIDHSDFSLLDELKYNFRRAEEKKRQQSIMPQNEQISRLNKLQGMPEMNWNDIIVAGMAGAGEGMLAGINRGLNAATLGKYGEAADKLLDNIYTNQQNRMQNQAEQAGLGKANKLANTAIDISSQILAGKFFKF
ncbi:MAG: hypothetical protein Q4D80_05465 [Pseudomonadota bacterium]|nr:hypothetical protein [Pseudomonadota bacterium]